MLLHLSMARLPFKRRHFLKGTALAGMGAWVARPLPAQESEAAEDPIRVAVIGVGRRGQAHLQRLLAHPGVKVVAVVDVDARLRRQAVKRVIEATGQTAVRDFEDFRECLAAELAEAAVIAVPNHWHALIAVDCARAGLDLYGEIPLAHSIVEGRAICRAVARHGCVWQTGNEWRSDPVVQRACGLVAGGRLGVVRSVEVGTYGGVVDRTGASSEGFFQSAAGLNYDFWLGPAPWLPYHPGRVHENWRWHDAFGGGQLMSWVGKYVDVALWALGLDRGGPSSVEATGEFARHALYNVVERYDIEATYFSGMKLLVSSSLAPGVRWHGDRGWLYVHEGGVRASSPHLLEGDEESEWAMERFARYGRDHWQDFLTAIRTRRPTIAPCESAQRAASIGHLGLVAMSLGRALDWDAEAERAKDDSVANERLERAYRQPWMLED